MRSAQTAPPIPPPGQAGGVLAGLSRVNNDTALRNSAVWACLRLRADLVSTMPVKAYREVDGVEVEVPKPPILISPGGDRVDMQEWLYSTQVDLDRAGNAFGIITERNALGLPARIELASLGDCSVRMQRGNLEYVIAGTTYQPDKVWHEKQFTLAGLAVGLNPIAYAAYTLGAYLSAMQFALDWFGNSAMPAVDLKNVEKTVPADVAAEVKRRYQASVSPGGVFVHGNDWEIKPIQSMASQSQYLDMMRDGVPDVARYFGCPADLIDGAVSGSSLTYATIGQRNLQFLIMHLGPAVTRRETALSTLLPRPRYVKLNRNALLAMDPQTRATVIGQQLKDRVLTPTEARALDERAPLTDADLAEFDRVYGAPRTQPTEAKS
jgi:HK97 family phage portal protein